MDKLSANISLAVQALQEIIRVLEIKQQIQRKTMMSLKAADDQHYWLNHEKLCRLRSDIQLMQTAQNTLLVMSIEYNGE